MREKRVERQETMKQLFSHHFASFFTFEIRK